MMGSHVKSPALSFPFPSLSSLYPTYVVYNTTKSNQALFSNSLNNLCHVWRNGTPIFPSGVTDSSCIEFDDCY